MSEDTHPAKFRQTNARVCPTSLRDTEYILCNTCVGDLTFPSAVGLGTVDRSTYVVQSPWEIVQLGSQQCKSLERENQKGRRHINRLYGSWTNKSFRGSPIAVATYIH